MYSRVRGTTVGVVLVVKGGFGTRHYEVVVGGTAPFDKLRANVRLYWTDPSQTPSQFSYQPEPKSRPSCLTIQVCFMPSWPVVGLVKL